MHRHLTFGVVLLVLLAGCGSTSSQAVQHANPSVRTAVDAQPSNARLGNDIGSAQAQPEGVEVEGFSKYHSACAEPAPIPGAPEYAPEPGVHLVYLARSINGERWEFGPANAEWMTSDPLMAELLACESRTMDGTTISCTGYTSEEGEPFDVELVVWESEVTVYLASLGVELARFELTSSATCPDEVDYVHTGAGTVFVVAEPASDEFQAGLGSLAQV